MDTTGDESPTRAPRGQTKRWLALAALLVVATAAIVRLAFWKTPVPVGKEVERTTMGDHVTFPVPKVPFTNVTDASRLVFTHDNGATGKKLLPETMGGGVCVFDFDGDGWQDVLFVSSCPWPGHKASERTSPSCLVLYRNLGNGTFEDVTAASGLSITIYGMGACAGDIDNDGYPDLFVTGVGGCKLFHNIPGPNGTRKFQDITSEAGITTRGHWPERYSAEQFFNHQEPIEFATSATFLDYDGDGRLDLFVCHYVNWSPAIDLAIEATLTGVGRAYLPPQQFEGSQCKLYRNLGNSKFQDVTESAGIKVTDPVLNAPDRPVAKSLGVVVCDVDGDGWPDLVVANDTVRNFFFHNVPAADGGRKFEEQGKSSNVAFAEGRARGAMGIDWGEYLPGKHGLAIANFANEPMTFLTMPDPRRLRFTDSAQTVNIAGPSRPWLKFGTFFFDYDLDGRLDLFVCNGHLEPEISKVQTGQQYAQPPQLYWNKGQQGNVFEPVTSQDSGEDLFQPLVGRGCAYLDFNRDGLLDVIVVENGGKARLLRNDSRLGNHFVRLTLVGDGKTANTSAIGAQLTIEAGGQTYLRQVAGARGYLSQSELPVTFGLGNAQQIDKLTVRWPGREAGTQSWVNLAANTHYTLRQGKAEPEVQTAKK